MKVVKNGHGGEAVPGDWDLTAEGDEKGFTDKGDSDTFHEVTAGQPYALSESTVEGYYLETPPGWSCDGGKQDGATITLAAEESVTCTVINNDKKPSLKLVKEVVNDYGEAADPSEWTLTATGPRTFSGPGPVVNSPNSFQQGTYELSESVGPDGYARVVGSARAAARTVRPSRSVSASPRPARSPTPTSRRLPSRGSISRRRPTDSMPTMRPDPNSP